MAGRRGGTVNIRAIAVLLCVWLLLCAVGGTYFARSVIHPAMNEISEIKAKAMVSSIMNGVVRERFQKEVNAASLLLISTNDEGNIEMVQSDTGAMNLLVSELSAEIQKKYDAMEAQEITVPLGTLVRNSILTQVGPSIDIKVLPMSVSGSDFKTEFESQGINQTKYKVYVTLQSKVKIMAPLSTRTIETSSTVLIAEAVILGQVPSSYVNIPKEGLTDVLNY